MATASTRGLQGFECLSGIPGSTGATPIQNVGAYGQEVAETVESVRVLDRASGQIVELPAAELRLPLPRQHLQVPRPPRRARGHVPAARVGRLRPAALRGAGAHAGRAVGGSAPLADVREAVLALRRGKGMVIDPADPDSVSAGSFFTNPILDPGDFARLQTRTGDAGSPPAFPEPDGRIKTSAAWLIERAGFPRGYGDGRVGISTKHTLALVNRGGATTAELMALAREIAGGVRERFGVPWPPSRCSWATTGSGWRAQRPVNCGGRFSRKAVAPSA